MRSWSVAEIGRLPNTRSGSLAESVGQEDQRRNRSAFGGRVVGLVKVAGLIGGIEAGLTHGKTVVTLACPDRSSSSIDRPRRVQRRTTCIDNAPAISSARISGTYP